MNAKQEYSEALKGLPVREPDIDDPRVRALFPHLDNNEVEGALQARNGRSNFVATPPLIVSNAFQIVQYFLGIERPSELSWAFASRSRSQYKYSDKAMKFAEKNWGEDLVSRRSRHFVTMHLEDPSRLNERGYPTFVRDIYFTIRRKFEDIINDYSKPKSQLFNNAIVYMTTNPFIAKELEGDASYTMFNCAYCGSGLGLNGCGGCGHRFEDDQMRGGDGTPIPLKLAQLLTSEGFAFKKDPKISLEAEQRQFEERHYWSSSF